ncbi:hypothetical protein B7C42_08277 [Nocardia cerradoensis]|uniref:Uncharacterized protein n=1 Tax=Nocardia cerradoensis TaxID=85688 RepID=A0A231GSX7_9NOCA|nr:hypothetical protein B7C42_08277 [Nocardia cerradoensis]
MRSGRGRAVSAGRSASDRLVSTREARAATLPASKTRRTGTRVSRAAPSRAATRVALSELPPSAKKSSSRPTRSMPSTSANTAATSSSTTVTGAANTCASNTGAGNALRSSFPEVLRGNESSTVTTAGTMYEGSAEARPARSAVGSR